MDPRVAQTIVNAQRDALFTGLTLRPSTTKIDPPNASQQELEEALSDCEFYWNYCYPESDNELVMWIEAACIQELERRSDYNMWA